MRKTSSRYTTNVQILSKGLVYLFLFLFVNALIVPAYKLILENIEISYWMESDAEEKATNEGAEKLSELDKEYITSKNNTSLMHFILKDNHYFHLISGLLIYYPEKDSPPPKVLYYFS